MKTRSRTITIHINLPLKALLRENDPTPQPPSYDEFEDDEMFMCEECYGFGYVGTEEKPEDCEACDGHGIVFEELEEIEYDSDSDPDWIPAIDELSDTDISLDDLTDCESDGSECGSACNDKVCFCGTV